MAFFLSRVLLRRSATTTRFITRPTSRYESTATKATETLSKASKAVETLTKVTSAAGTALTGAANGFGKALGKIGGRTGTLIAFTQRQIPRVLYYARVSQELAKIVFHGQNMSPPSASTFQAHFHWLIEKFQNPSTLLSSLSINSTAFLQQARNIRINQVASGAVVFAEVLGFFTVGEILGRRKLVGYQGQTAHH